MNIIRWILPSMVALVFMCVSMNIAQAAEIKNEKLESVDSSKKVVSSTLDSVIQVQKYNRSIHVMAMLLVGFGFLMVFVRGYGLSALTATYLMTAVGIPLYMLLKSFGLFGHSAEGIDALILAEFAVASLLICAGAVLGRLKMWQYIILAIMFIPAYMLNEYIVLDGKFAIVKSFADTGGSIVIHAFGALFGLGVAVSMTAGDANNIKITSDFTSDRFSLLGSMVLWIFWPSFCAAIVAPEVVIPTVINVVMALCGSTLLTYVATMLLRKKIEAADIANATLAGGVAIGSTCDTASLPAAMLIGAVAGFASTFGFAVVQSRLEKIGKLVDTCGVSNLHGIPGVLGGVVAVFVISEIDVASQFIGIGVTAGIAIVAGFIVGKAISLTGTKKEPYQDNEEFEDPQNV